MMRVCLFTETYYPVVGGGETQARALADGLAAAGIAVDILTRRSDAALPARETQGLITIHRLPPVGPQHYNKWGLLVTGLPALLRLRYDVLYVSGFRVIGLAAVIISWLRGKPCVLKADSLGEMSGAFFSAGLRKRGLSPDFFLFRGFLAARNWLLRRAQSFVAISAAIEGELSAAGVPEASICHIPNSVATNQFVPVDSPVKAAHRRALNLPSDVPLVIYTGRLVTYKGLPLLLRVWQQVSQLHPDAVLVLVGAGGMDIHNCEGELREFAQAKQLPVIFTGAVSNVADYLQAADIFVFPSTNEAFGISVIEALACGLPVITTAAGGLRDIVQHDHNGLVVPVDDFDALRDAISALLSDPTRASALGAAARQTAETCYATDAIVRRHIALFEELMGDHRP